jgi:hypothetical protein
MYTRRHNRLAIFTKKSLPPWLDSNRRSSVPERMRCHCATGFGSNYVCTYIHIFPLLSKRLEVIKFGMKISTGRKCVSIMFWLGRKQFFFYLQNGNGSRDCGFKNGLFFQRGAKDILCQTYFENTFWHLSDGSLSISLQGVDCVVKKYFS